MNLLLLHLASVYNTTGLDSSYQAYLNKITANGYVLPPSNIQIAQDRFVKDLKAAGLWSRMKTGYFFHAGSIETGRVNIKDPDTYTLTIAEQGPVVPIFIQGVGTRSNGITGYFIQPFKSNEYAGIESDLTIIQYLPHQPFASQYPVSTFSSGFDLTLAGATDNYIATIPFYAEGLGSHRRGTTGNQSFTSNSHNGLLVSTYDGTNAVVYKDGTKTSEAVTPAVPNNSINRFILAANNDGSAVVRYARLVSADFLFDRFNDADEALFRSIWNTYKNSVNLDFQIVCEYASHCWFARNKSAYDPTTNKSWIGQVHADSFAPANTGYSQFIFEINNDTNVITKFKLGTVTQYDDHNEPSILIRSSDNRLIAVYSEHSGALLRWRISTNPNDATAWGSEQTLNPVGGGHVYTYPSVFEAENGHIYIFFRDQIGTTQRGWSYVKSTNGGATFGGYARITGVTYSTLAQDPNNKDKIHFLVCWHPDNTIIADNYILHGYWNCSTNTFHKSDGTDITASIPVDETDMTVIDTALIANDQDCWIEDIIIDNSGNPRVLYTKIPDMPTALLKDEYYSEWTGSAWTTPHLLHRSATHYMETELLDTNLLSIWYPPNSSFDRANPDRIFSSIETAGDFGNVCEIWELHRQSSSSFTRQQRTYNSAKDQWRPFTVASPTNNVFWLNKIYYDHWANEYYQTLVLKTY